MIHTTVEFIIQRFSSNNGTEEVICLSSERELRIIHEHFEEIHPEWDMDMIKRTTIEEYLT